MKKWSSSKRRRVLVFGTAVLLISVVCTGTIMFMLREKAPKTASDFYRQGSARLIQKEFGPAYTLLSEAVRMENSNTQYLDAAADAALGAGRLAEASQHATAAWKSGLKDKKLFGIISQHLRVSNRTRGAQQALTLWEEFPHDQKTEEFKGDVWYFFENREEALGHWQATLATNATPVLLNKICKVMIESGQAGEAIKLFDAHRPKGILNEESYLIYTTLRLLDDAKEETVLQLYEEAKIKGRYDDRLKLEHAVANLIFQRYDEAREILATMTDLTGKAEVDLVRGHARLYYGYLLFGKKDEAGIRGLLSTAGRAQNPAWKEGEQSLYEGLLRLLSGKNDALEFFAKAHKLIPKQAAIAVLHAGECVKAGKPSEAAATLLEIRGVLGRWPALQLQLALAFANNNEDTKAIHIISRLHRRGIYSKETLELYRTLTLRNDYGQFASAAQKYLEQEFGEDPSVQMHKGLFALREGKTAQATAVFEQLSRQYPAEPQFQAGRLQVLLAEGKYQQMLDLCRTSNIPQSQQGVWKGLAHARLEQWEAAAAAFAAVTTGDSPAPILIEYGSVLVRLNKPQEAEAQFQLALKKDPENVEAQFALAMLAYNTKQLERARKFGRSVMVGDSKTNAVRLSALASAEISLQEYNQALEYSQVAISRDPNSADALAAQGTAHLALGAYDEAEINLTAALSKRPGDSRIKERLALVLIKKAKYAKALELADQVLAAKPDNAVAQLLRFDALTLGGRWEAAGKALGSLERTLPPLHYALASASFHERKGDNRKAVEVLQPHLANEEAVQAWAKLQFILKNEAGAMEQLQKQKLSVNQWAALASSAEKQNLVRAAALCYHEALKLNSDDAILLNNWAWNAMNTPDFKQDEVLLACRRAYDAQRRNPVVLDTYAEGLLRTKNHDECIKLLTANNRITDRTPQLLWALGEAYAAKGSIPQALDAYKRCQELLALEKTWELRQGSNDLSGRIAALTSR